MLDVALTAVENSALAEALRTSRTAYPIVNGLHIIGLAVLFGSILSLDLKLLGLFPQIPVQPLALYLPRVSACGLALAAATGLLLFSIQPRDYAENSAFLIKVGLVLIGTAHAAWVHSTQGWKRAARENGSVAKRLRVSAGLSLSIWSAAILAGRFIAF